MPKTTPEQNKAIVLEAFDTLFNKRDYAAAERYWSPRYIQHSAHIEPGREGLFNLIKGIPPTLRYEAGPIVADGDFVIVHGRFSGFGAPVNWIAADILRIEDGVLVEHWDVIQDEATEEQSKSKAPMFGSTFQHICESVTLAGSARSDSHVSVWLDSVGPPLVRELSESRPARFHLDPQCIYCRPVGAGCAELGG